MSLTGNLQARILSAANRSSSAVDFNGSLHILADLYNVAAGDVNGRTLAVARQLDSSISSASPALNYLLNNIGAVPTMGLNFLNSTTLDSRITFTRSDAVTCATYFDSTGRLATAAANVARFDYDPATLQPRGLLIEESRQNLLLQSRDMTQAAWTKTDVTPARTQVGLDGVANTACLMTEGSAGTAITVNAAGGVVTAGSTLTASMVFKRGNTDWVRLLCGDDAVATNGAQAWFNLATGAKGTVSAKGTATNLSSSITSLGGGWYRCTVTGTPNGTFTQAYLLMMSASADASTTRVSGATYIVDCAQLEVGAFATSIIPTTTTALTRAADSASMTGANFSSWFNASAGTFVAEASSVSASSGANKLVYRLNGAFGSGAIVSSTGVRQVFANATFLNFGAATNYSVEKFAHAYDGAGFYATVGGQAVQSGADVMSAVTSIGIGGNGTQYLNGHIRRLTYYPTRLANATLVSLTA